MDLPKGPSRCSSAFADHFPDAVVVVSLRERRCVYANVAADRVLGGMLPLFVLEPGRLRDFAAADDAAQVERTVADLLAGKTARATVRLTGANPPSHLVLRSFPLPDSDDPSLIALVCENATGVPQPGLAMVADHIPDVVWVMAPDGTHVQYVGAAYGNIWQRPVEELYASPFKWMQSVHPEDQGRVLEMVTLEQAERPLEYVFRIARGDGEVRQIRNRSVPVGEGDLARVVVVSEDITEEYRRSRQAEESARAQRDALVREVHHRIKNNLQGVTGMMRNYANQHPETGDVINEAIAQVQAVAIIHGLQGQSGATQVLFYDLLKQVVFGVGQLMHRALEFPPPEACRNCRIIVSEMEAVPVALVLNEMIFNALKHGSADMPPVIDIHVDIGQERIELSVSNAGSLPDTAGRHPGGGSGLLLIRSLLPSRGAQFDLYGDKSGVEAKLVLGPPIITLRC